jgi:hypothetical protein
LLGWFVEVLTGRFGVGWIAIVTFIAGVSFG